MTPPSLKVNVALRLLLFLFALILWRLWYVTLEGHEVALEAAKRPQRRLELIPAERGTIRDRFNIPLALNRIQYNVTLTWQQLQSPERSVRRKEYITALAKILEPIIEIDREEIEDLIYAKAALLMHIPFLLKAGLSEEQYFQLKILEGKWPGLAVQTVSRRYYPQGPVACHILGYLGAISQGEYDRILFEMRALREFLARTRDNDALDFPAGFSSFTEVEKRLDELEQAAYCINDVVGKSGIELQFEEQLRGRYGRHLFCTDRLGRHLDEELSMPAQNGTRLLLSISSELQAFAEKLLEENEQLREGKSTHIDPKTHQAVKIRQPWIKGGAIVALDPKTGEVLALASYPRFDPNDFIPGHSKDEREKKWQRVLRSLETPEYVAELWEQKIPLERILKGKTQQQWVTWSLFLEMLFPENHPLKAQLERATIAEAIAWQTSQQEALVHDLCHLLVPHEHFTPFLIETCGKKTLQQYREDSRAFFLLEGLMKQLARKQFHQVQFAAWRKEHQKSFLREKRLEEKKQGRPARSYLDYLQQEEAAQFAAFWANYRIPLLALLIKEQATSQAHFFKECFEANTLPLLRESLHGWTLQQIGEYLATFRHFNELKEPLKGHYAFLLGKKVQTEKDLAASFYPQYGLGYGRSWAFRQSTQVGSLFKLVPAYCALIERYQANLSLNPFSMIDDLHLNFNKTKWLVGSYLDGTVIPQIYKGGRIPRSEHSGIGLVDLSGALESSSNPYMALLAAEEISSPQAFLEAMRLLGFGARTGIALPGEIAGYLPEDLERNRTGLYSSAIGQHTLVTTPLQAAVMLAAIANGGKVWRPKIVHLTIGQKVGESIVELLPSEAIREILLPQKVQHYLLNALHQVMVGPRGTGRAQNIRSFAYSSAVMRNYRALQGEIVGKTSTAEVMEKIQIVPDVAQMVKHIGFGAIAFEGPPLTSDPELVVVVYLRFGDFGREAAPLATELISKWREIKKKYLIKQ